VALAALTVASSVVIAGGPADSVQRNGNRRNNHADRFGQGTSPQGGEKTGNGVPARFVAEVRGRIAVVSANTGRVERYLTAAKPGGGAVEPALSHDGRTVWFSRVDGACAAHLAFVPVAGGDEQTLPGSGEAGPEGTPLPRPGRRQIAYARASCDRGPDHALIVSDLAGDEGHGQLGLLPLAWSRDGDQLLATASDGDEVRLLDLSPAGAIVASRVLAPADPSPGCRLEVAGFSPDDDGYVAVRRCGQPGEQARRSLVVLDKELTSRQTVLRLPRGQDFVDGLAFDTTGHSLLFSTAPAEAGNAAAAGTPDDGVALWVWRDGDVRRLARPSRYRHPAWLP
jgi:dipeptidyl aminopeptidase/acylaminoacyl peptidase